MAAVPSFTFIAADAVWFVWITSVPEPTFVTAPEPPRLAFSVATYPCVSMVKPSVPTVNQLSAPSFASMEPSAAPNTNRVPLRRALLSGRSWLTANVFAVMTQFSKSAV